MNDNDITIVLHGGPSDRMSMRVSPIIVEAQVPTEGRGIHRYVRTERKDFDGRVIFEHKPNKEGETSGS